MGWPEPPSDEDVANAERFVDEFLATQAPLWARHRDDLIRSQAKVERAVRLRREAKEQAVEMVKPRRAA